MSINKKRPETKNWHIGFAVANIFYIGVLSGSIAQHATNYKHNATQAEREDLSVKQREVYQKQAASELDIMLGPSIFNPFARADINSPLDNLYRQSELPPLLNEASN